MSIYAELRALQHNACGICGTWSDLVVDHDHDSGLIRGLLCRGCNVREGLHNCMFSVCGGDVNVTGCPFDQWRRRPAVAWLGWTEKYVPQVQRISLPDDRDAFRPSELIVPSSERNDHVAREAKSQWEYSRSQYQERFGDRAPSTEAAA